MCKSKAGRVQHMRAKHGTTRFSKPKSVNGSANLSSQDSIRFEGTASPDPTNDDFAMSPILAFGMFSGAFNPRTIC
jgi:hypothetical protein